jgi:leucine dehydrogenase
MTAFGVFQGMKAAAKHAGFGDRLEGLRVSIQGVGNVGYHLCSYLSAAGAKLIITDIYENQIERIVQEFGATVVQPDQIYAVDSDIFAPCALGAILNARTIPQLKCKVVAGSANNQLESDVDGYSLHARGITYAPDYAINSGGLINVAAELEGYNYELVRQKVTKVYFTIAEILQRSDTQGILPHQAADAIAQQRLDTARANGTAPHSFATPVVGNSRKVSATV